MNDFVDPSGPKLVSCRSPLQFNQFGRRAIPFKSSFVGCHFESPVGWSLTLTDGFQTLGHVSPIRSSFQKRRKKVYSRIFLDIWLPVNFLFTLKASSLPDMESIYFTTKSYFTSICFLRVQMNSLFYMSVKKSGSYITIPVFDVSWVVNFLKQVSMNKFLCGFKFLNFFF